MALKATRIFILISLGLILSEKVTAQGWQTPRFRDFSAPVRESAPDKTMIRIAQQQAEGNQEVAESEAQVAPPQSHPLDPSRQQVEFTRDWSSLEIVLSVAMLAFGIVVLIGQTLLIMKLPLSWTPTAILRLHGLTLIIVGSMVLIIAGYSNQQMLPVIGLFGTIAGYLLGASEKPTTT